MNGKTDNSKLVIGLLVTLSIVSLSGLLFVLVLYRQQTTKFEDERLALRASVSAQKKDKDVISRIWEEQAAQNDTIIKNQTVLLDKVQAYLANVQKSVRFINTVPQLTSEANESKFQNNLTNLQAAIDELNKSTAENNSKKEEYKLKIETIYQQSGEDLKNRANPDGIK